MRTNRPKRIVCIMELVAGFSWVLLAALVVGPVIVAAGLVFGHRHHETVGEMRARKAHCSQINKTKNKRDVALLSAAIGAAATVVVAFVVPVMSNLLAQEVALDCPTAIKTTLEVVKDTPSAWVKLPSDNPYERACHLNEVAQQVTGAMNPQAG